MNNTKVVNTGESIPQLSKEVMDDLKNKSWEGLNKNQKILVHVKKLLKKAKTKEYRQIKSKNKILYEQKLRQEFDQLDRFYPSLFRMIIDDPINFDMIKLKRMLSMKDKVDNNEVSYDDANKKIGIEYYNKYVKKHVDKIDVSDKKEKNNDLKNLYQKLTKNKK